jgi:hypothetical protein
MTDMLTAIGVEARFAAVAAVSTVPALPILLTRVGHE